MQRKKSGRPRQQVAAGSKWRVELGKLIISGDKKRILFGLITGFVVGANSRLLWSSLDWPHGLRTPPEGSIRLIDIALRAYSL